MEKIMRMFSNITSHTLTSTLTSTLLELVAMTVTW